MADVYLYTGAGSASDIVLRDPTIAYSFPAQVLGLRAYFGGSVQDLCMVAVSDAPSGVGGRWLVQKGGTVYAVYLVETTDPNASPVRVRTSTGTKAVRMVT